MTVLETENLTHYYENGMAGAVAAIENINVKFEKGEIVGIIGHTGSGKSTLLQHLNGLLKPDSGRVLLCGEDINKDKRTLRAARFRVGLCFQYPEYQLFEETVYKDISFGPKNMGLDSAEIDRRVRRAAEFEAQERLTQLALVEKTDRAAACKAHGGRCTVKLRECVHAARAHRAFARQKSAADHTFGRIEQIKQPRNDAHTLPSRRSLRPE